MVLLAWAAVGLFAAAAARDLLTRQIDDWLVASAMAVWGAWAVGYGMSPGPALLHMATGIAAFVVMWGLFVLGWMGGGDVKLSAAVFLWAGPDLAIGTIVIIAVSGLLVAVLCLIARLAARRWPPPSRVGAIATPWSSDHGVPYGIALAAGGTLAALASTAPMAGI